MKILAASDDSGSLKQIICQKGTDTSSKDAPQPKSVEQFLEQGLRNRIQKILVMKQGEEKFIILARANGQISFHKEESYDLINTITDGLSEEKDQFVSLIYSFGLIIATSEQGKVTIINSASIQSEKVKTQTTTIKAPVSAFSSHPEQVGIFAFGGKENDIKIVRLFKSKDDLFKDDELKPETLFQGKNVKNDRLDLRVPIWITSILFVNLSSHTSSSWKFITTTRYGDVRKYDTTHGRKPLFSKKLSDKPIAHTSVTPNENEIICSDTHVTTALFNVEKGTLVAKYKGAVGAVQDLYTFLNGDKSLLVTGGLDRYIRVFNIKSREQVAKVFIGSKISGVWLLEDTAFEEEGATEEERKDKKKIRKFVSKEEEEKEDDELWKTLDKSNKKRKTK